MTSGMLSSIMLFILRLPFDDALFYFPLNLRSVMARNLTTGCKPDPLMAADIYQRLVQCVDPIREPDKIGMKRNVHDAPGLLALPIEYVKLSADHFPKIGCGDVSPLKGLFVVDVIAVRHRDERFPIIQRHQVRLIVVG